MSSTRRRHRGSDAEGLRGGAFLPRSYGEAVSQPCLYPLLNGFGYLLLNVLSISHLDLGKSPVDANTYLPPILKGGLSPQEGTCV